MVMTQSVFSQQTALACIISKVDQKFQKIPKLKMNGKESSISGIGISSAGGKVLPPVWAANGRVAYSLSVSPFGRQSKISGFREPVVQVFQNKLPSWRKVYLSLGVRITLIKANPLQLPIYY